MLSLKRSGSPVAASPRKVVNSTAWRYLCARVKRMKYRLFAPFCSRLLFVACSRSGILASFCRSSLHLVVSRANQPQYGVNQEEREHAGQQQIHEQADIVEGRVQLPVARV